MGRWGELSWTIARAAVAHRLVDDAIGFLRRNRLAFRVHLGKILLERGDDLLASLIGYGGWLESPNAYGFLLRNRPPEQAFDRHSLVWREVFHVTDHKLPPNYIMPVLWYWLESGIVR
jgi:hypothetical protein